MRTCPQCEKQGIPVWAIPGPLARTTCRTCGAQVSATWGSTTIPILLILASWMAFFRVDPLMWKLVIAAPLLVAGLTLWNKARLVAK